MIENSRSPIRRLSAKGYLVNREQYANMLKDICETHKQGGDVPECIAKYKERYKYVYIYNDNIFKMLFGTPENESITVDFLNAVLCLHGSDCLEHLDFVNPAEPGAFSKSITSLKVWNGLCWRCSTLKTKALEAASCFMQQSIRLQIS